MNIAEVEVVELPGPEKMAGAGGGVVRIAKTEFGG
jgi:hypothetical protein